MSPPPSAIICLDLDGTTVEYDALHAWFSEAVAEELNAAVRRGVVWCTNSGRNAHNQYGMVQSCRPLAALPFAVLAGERYIYDVHPTTGAMRSREPYNRLAKQKARELSPRVQEALAPHLVELETRFARGEYFPASDFVGWLLDESADPPAFAEYVRTLLVSVDDAQVLRNGRWVLVIHADFGKGRVLTEAARALGVPRQRILALGDQHNDVDMLEGRYAAFVGCPADADPTARAAVERAGGWVADQPGVAGTCQLIRRFVEDVLPRIPLVVSTCTNPLLGGLR